MENNIELMTEKGIVVGVKINGDEIHDVSKIEIEHTPQQIPLLKLEVMFDPRKINYVEK